MKNGSVQKKLREIAEPVLASLGYELVDVEYATGGGAAVARFFIDKEGGVDVEDCARASRELDPVLDVEDVISSSYSLEVSSPGVNRPIRRKEDFEKFAGERVKIRTYAKLEDRKIFVGELLGVEDDEVLVDIDGAPRRVPLDAIAKANLQRL